VRSQVANSYPTIAIIAAHPDDEVIGSTSVLLRSPAGCRVIHVTDGAPRDMRDARAAGFGSRAEYARARRAELAAALSLSRIDPGLCREIGVADQEAVFEIEPLTRRLVALWRDDPPALVVTHAYEGGHPDHDAAALAVHAARALLRREHGPAPAIVEMTSYHAGAGGIETGTFLRPRTVTGARRSPPVATAVRLNSSERHIKEAMLSCFATQRHVLAYFNTGCERFRAAPFYRFVDPPHAGRLFYEFFAWNVDGGRWRELAARALRALDLDPSACH
jgi:LmbE family N-acetylglucosaminyl deacetylase